MVGVLVTNSVELEILPKIDSGDESSDEDYGGMRQNLIGMLAKVFSMKVSRGELSVLGWQRENLLEILVGLFCREMLRV